MADGITQPGGAGTTIFFQNNAHADAGGDGLYSAADFSAKFPARVVDVFGDGSVYNFLDTIQRGDGVGTSPTTWKDTRKVFRFAPGKTYLTSAVGQSNGLTEWGTLLTSAAGEPVGYDGCHAIFQANPGAAAGINGNVKFYGCILENRSAVAATSRIFINPGFDPNVSDMVDVTVFTLAGLQSFGFNSPFSQINRMKRVRSIGLGSAANGHIVQFNSPEADVIVMAYPNGDRKIATAAYIRVGHPIFIGPSSAGSSGDARSTQATVFLDPIWSQDTSKSEFDAFYEGWNSYSLLVTDAASLPIAGVRVEIFDSFDGRFVVNTTTDANGRISFLAPQSIAESPPFYTGPGPYPNAPFSNALLVEGHNNDGVIHAHYPFTLYINRDQGLPSYMQVQRLLSFPFTTFGANSYKQFFPISQHIILNKRTPGSGAEDWRDTYA